MGVGQHPDFDPNAFGPFGPLVQAYVSAFESLGMMPGEAGAQKLSAPFKAVARCQLEMLGLANRRAQAYLHFPARLAQCHSPRDFSNEQMAFWRTAAEQYGDAYRRVYETWAGFEAWSYPGGRPDGAERDYINFNGTGSRDSAPLPSDPAISKQRRVA